MANNGIAGPPPLSSRSLAAVGLLTCSTVFITGTSPDYPDNSITPVYMSYEKLRSSAVIEPPRELDALGQIYLYNNYPPVLWRIFASGHMSRRHKASKMGGYIVAPFLRSNTDKKARKVDGLFICLQLP